MKEALKEVETRGDKMMGVINDQWEALASLQYKVKCEREILEKAQRATEEKDMQRKYLEWEKIVVEREATKIKRNNEKVEKELEKLEQQKKETRISLETLDQKTFLARQEVAESKEELIRQALRDITKLKLEVLSLERL